jgi:putative ABC transport system permease protein
MILKSFGAEGFHFVISWELLVGIPAAVLGASVPALLAGIAEIGRIKAYECCNRRE